MKKLFGKITEICVCVLFVLLLLAFTACGDDIVICEHEWTLVSENAALCAQNGEKHYTCAICENNKIELIPALGHELPKEGEQTKDPSCSETGITSYVCAVCGDTVTEPVAVTGHTYDNGEITTDPGCFSDGVMTYSCTVCEYFYTEAVQPVGHGDYDFDGDCDRCETFIGEVAFEPSSTVPFVGGPWENPEGFSWWSYNLEKSCSEEATVFVSTDEKYHTEGQKSLKIDFTNSSKTLPDHPDGAYVLHLGMDHLQRRGDYTLTFYAWASENFNGNLNKILCNMNFGNSASVEAVTYDKVYGTAELAGTGWVEVQVNFIANPSLSHSDRSAIRFAFDVGTDGWQGELYLADFKVSLTDYLRVQQGLPPLNEPTKPVNTTPVLDEIPANAVTLPDSISEGAVWTEGPCTSGDGIISIDKSVEYAKGGKSLLFNVNRSVKHNSESAAIIPIPGLTDGEKYQLTFYAQGSETFDGALDRIFGNPNFTHIVQNEEGQNIEVSTMLDVTVNASVLYKAGEMIAKDWVKCSLVFTAHPKNGFCSLRIQMKNNGNRGQLWLSGFEIGDAPEEAKDVPQIVDPVESELSSEHVALPDSISFGGAWEAGPLYTGDAIFEIDNTVEYATGAKSVKIDYNKTSDGESALILPFDNLEDGKRYRITFRAQGSTNFNGALDNILENRNYDTDGIPTMLNVSIDKGDICTAGKLNEGGWKTATIEFDANPKNGLCSLRLQIIMQESYVGTLWLSYFEVEEIEPPPAPEYGMPQIKDPVLTELPKNHVALPDSFNEGYKDCPFVAGNLYCGDSVFDIDDTVEYATGAKSIRINYNNATVGTQSAAILAFDNLEKDKVYRLTFRAQGSTDFNGALDNIVVNGSFDTDGVPTMLDVTVDRGDLCTVGAMNEGGWKTATVEFKANPKSDPFNGNKELCSLRIQFIMQEDWIGTLWLSGFEIEEISEPAVEP